MSDETTIRRLEVVNAVLALAVRYPNLLLREPLEELAAIIRKHVPFARFAVLTPEGDQHPIYALSASSAEPVGPFGTRVPKSRELIERVYLEGGQLICDDTRVGTPIERDTAAVGYLSYVILPARSAGPKREVLAELAFAFKEVGAARRADLELLQAVADVVGMSFERLTTTARERRLAMVLDTSSDAVLAWDRAGRITDTNAAADALAGRPERELIGMRIGDVLDAGTDSPDGWTLRPGGRMTLKARAEDGSERALTVAATVTEVADDPLVRAHALLRDLTTVLEREREVAANLLRIRELEAQHRALLDNAPLIIFRLDPRRLELEYLNQQAERLLGVPTETALATPGFLRDAHADPEGVAAFEAAVVRAQAGAGSRPYEARIRRQQGDPLIARGTVYPLLNERGEVVAIEGLLADVSGEHAARTRLVQADRLATLGTLAAGVAHEINNPAAFILLGLDMLDRLVSGTGVKMEPGTAENARELFTELRDSIRRIVDIARDLRLFASPPAASDKRRAIVDVNRTVESAISLTRSQILERAQLVRSLDDVPPVMMEDGRLGQVVVNLLVNAAQAIQRTAAREHSVSVVTRSDGRFVEIEVTDTGVGVPEENQDRIWEPFFTTKSADTGTGLGLSISREIIERAGGTIQLESPVVGREPMSGARFRIVLPAAGQIDVATPISSPLPRVPARRVRVLLVEDEAPLAKALAEELARLHDVTVADGAERALALLEDGAFDVILCDLRMPGMSGEALYRAVVERDPSMREAFIFMTGVGFGADVERFLAAAGRPVLEKPFTADGALDAILRVLNRRLRAATRA